MSSDKPKVVHFFGAGSSKAIGKPLGCEIFAGEKWKTFDNKELFEEISVKLQIAPEKMDIEEVLRITDLAELFTTTTPEISFLIPFFSETGKEKLHLLSKLGKEIKDLIYDEYVNMDTNRCVEVLLPCFENFRPGITSSLTVFTTNYDRAIEHYVAARQNFAPYPTLLDGFKNDPAGSRIWDEKGHFTSSSSGGEWRIPFYKIHGSVGWIERNGRIYEYNVNAFQNIEKPVIVYPAYKNIPDQPIFDFAQEQLLKSLLGSDYCCVFGFSFRDPYITTIFRKALTRNEKLIVRLYLPDDKYPKDSGIPQLSRKFNQRFKNTLIPLGVKAINGSITPPAIRDFR